MSTTSINQKTVQKQGKSVQPKLMVNMPGDEYEQEADAMAEKIMRMPVERHQKPVQGIIGQSVQRKCSKCEEEEKNKAAVMRKAGGQIAGGSVSSSFIAGLSSSKAGGNSLPDNTRAFMESAFSADFSRVRIHSDSTAAVLNKNISAKAFTNGNDIYFNTGEFSPQSSEGKKLLAHELTHVVQQGGTENIIARQAINLSDIDRDFNNRRLTIQSATVGFGATRGKKMDAPTEDPQLPITAFFYLENQTPAPPPTVTPPTGSAASDPQEEIRDAGAGSDEVNGVPEAEETAPPVATSTPPSSTPPERALIIGNIHGDEGGARGTSVLGNQIKTELDANLASDFDVIVVPVVNPGGTADNTRTNRRSVDLNRNFPGLTNAAAPKAGQKIPPEQPETKAIKDIVTTLHPSRILSLHSIDSSNNGGFYADPVEGEAREMACEMALAVFNADPANEINVRGNEIAHGVCNSRYPETASVSVTTAQSSLGSWASADSSVGGGGGIPVITHEISDPVVRGNRTPLGTTGPGRTRDALMTGLRTFLLDHSSNPSQGDALLQGTITPTFLTGRYVGRDNELLEAIKRIVEARFNDMNVFYKNVWLPAQPHRSRFPARLTKASFERGFASQGGIIAREMQGINGRSNDAAIQAEILRLMQTRSMPGFSRHHWGTEIDVLSATRADWIGTGTMVPVIPFLEQHAHKFGFHHPYSMGTSIQQGFPNPSQPHYRDEPWHISYTPIANVLEAEWANLFQAQSATPTTTPTTLDVLIRDTAAQIASRGIAPDVMERVLRNIGLRDFQTNVAPAP